MSDGCIKFGTMKISEFNRKDHMALWLHTGMQLVVRLNQQCLFC